MISIASESVSVTRSIREILERAGWLVVTPVEATIRLDHVQNKLQLLYAGRKRELMCPIRPQMLLRELAASIQAKSGSPLSLAHGWAFDRTFRALIDSSSATQQILTEKETLLLTALLDASPGAVRRETLLREVWSYEADVETHTLETHIYRLRQKLEAIHPRPCDIETIEGAYRLVLEPVI